MNLKFPYRFQRNTSLAPVLNYMNTVHILTCLSSMVSSILIISFHLHLSLQKSFFPIDFATIISYIVERRVFNFCVIIPLENLGIYIKINFIINMSLSVTVRALTSRVLGCTGHVARME
jgi:hypothetical protein